MLTSLVALLVAGSITLLITPLVKRLAQRLDIIDKPDRKRKHHRRLVPLWGGLAIAIALLVTTVFCLLWLPDVQTWVHYRDHYLFNRLPWIACAYLIITIFGLIDDKKPLPPKVKLLVQFIAVGCIIFSGIYLKAFQLPGGTNLIELWPLVGMIITALWMVFIINAFNFIDGVDGLATSQAVVVGMGLMIAGLMIAHQAHTLLAGYQSRIGALLAAACAGAAWGFYRYNRWPAQLFLGDAGSTLLGFSLCLAGLLIIGEAPTAGAPWSIMLILGWPILDTVQVISRRYLKGEPISKADNQHLHHELQKRGFTKTATVAFITMVAVILSGLGIGLLWL